MRQILATTALSFFFGIAANAQNDKETVEGNGKSVTRDVAVQSFDALKASGVYELKLSQGSKESVRIEADKNLQEYFNVKNDGSKLVIDMKKLHDKNLKHAHKMVVYVTFKKLKDIDLSTVGNVRADESMSFDDLTISSKSVGNVELKLTVNKITLNNEGVGNVTLTGKAQTAIFKNEGVGSLKAGDFLVQTIDIKNTGVGHAEVNAEKSLRVEDSFLGKVKNKGAAPMKKKEVI